MKWRDTVGFGLDRTAAKSIFRNDYFSMLNAANMIKNRWLCFDVRTASDDFEYFYSNG